MDSFASDFEGNARPLGGVFDIGAYESKIGSSSGIARSPTAKRPLPGHRQVRYASREREP